jgi:conjugal transfer pilus assembly protein TraD
MSHLIMSATAGVTFGLPSPVAATAYGLLIGAGLARLLRQRGWHWVWATTLAPVALALSSLSTPTGLAVAAATVAAAHRGCRWHRFDLDTGGDLARLAGSCFTPLDALRLALRRLTGTRSIASGGLRLGYDPRGVAVRIPLGSERGGVHTLVLGATGSGKTVTQASITLRAVERRHGVIVIDPKGDAFLREQLVDAAASSRARFIEWSPDGPSVFNPFARGSETEIADKALAGERFSEPHYLRQAQRYVGHEVRVLRACEEVISLPTLVRHLEPVLLEVAARRLPEAQSQATFAYLDSLTVRQCRELSGIRDRLAVLSESDAGRWLDPDTPEADVFDLHGALEERAVVYFRLDADRRPLLAEMLGAAVVQDLITTVSALQGGGTPSLVMIDEFAAVGASNVARLFGRARSAGMSLLLGTQELADLRPGAGTQLLEQVLGNLSVLIAHRQVVPGSADLVAQMGGTRGAWNGAQRSDGTMTRTRSRELVVEPDEIRALPPGRAAVIALGTSGDRRVRLVDVQCRQ